MHALGPHTPEGSRGSHVIVHTSRFGTVFPVASSCVVTQSSVPVTVHLVSGVPQYGRHAPYTQARPMMQSPVPVQGRPTVADPAVTHDVAPVVVLVTSHV